MKSQFGIFQISEPIATIQASKAKSLDDRIKPHYIAHALVGNDDITNQANFIGNYLIDFGRNFLFHGSGYKENSANIMKCFFERRIVTLDRSQIREQLQAILSKQNELENRLWQTSANIGIGPRIREELLQHFADRLDELVINFGPDLRNGAYIDRRPALGQSAAGVLSWTVIDEKSYFLLGKRTDKNATFDCFGGEASECDANYRDTAIREVAEESSHCIQYTQHELLVSPFHDLISTKNDKPFIYRLYIPAVQCAYVDPKQFQDHEHTDYQWVAVDTIVKSLKNAEPNVDTITMQVNGIDIVLFPEFYKILKQQAVLRIIERVNEKKLLPNQHTQGVMDNPIESKNYRTIQSPQIIKESINRTLIHRANVLVEIKTKRIEQPDAMPLQQQRLSQSELHLKMLLGDDYKLDDINENIKLALKTVLQKHNIVLSDTAQDKLKIELAAWIETEKKNPDRLYFYHGCNSVVAFAYRVYTHLYQILQMNPKWFACRGLNKMVGHFNNIHDFIAHYSKNNTIDIDNYSYNFVDYAISTNLFIFGNHTNGSACSLVYFLTDRVCANVALQDMGACKRKGTLR